MKNYNFKIKTDTKNTIKKKSFTLKLKDKIAYYDLFQEAIDYLQENYDDHFKYSGYDYFSFELSRGVKSITCTFNHEYCPRCGGDAEIWGEYDENDESAIVK